MQAVVKCSKRVVFVSTVGQDRINEFVNDFAKDTVFVNVTNRTGVKVAWAIGHGLHHLMVKDGNEDILTNAIKAQLGQDALDTYLEQYASMPEYVKILEESGRTLEELVADRAGRLFISSEFWTALANAAPQERRAGIFKKIPEIVGLTVHYPGHMGVYIGNGQVVEARGTFYGVVQTALKARPRKNWAKSAVLTYEEEDDIMITRNSTPTKEVYDLQIAYKALGIDIGAWPDMVNGSPSGCDGKFGGTMELRTKELQAKYGLPVTGSVDAATYGKIALALLEKNTGITQAQVDAAVAAAVASAKAPLLQQITDLTASNQAKAAKFQKVASIQDLLDAIQAEF